MLYSKQRLYEKDQTGRNMHFLINRYYNDLKKMFTIKNGRRVPVLNLSLKDFFNLVRGIKYRKDIKPVEVISRPKHIINHRKMGMDCKKKAILIASFLKYKNYPYRLIASSRKPNGRIHHVFPQVALNGEWLNVDATYPHYKIFEPKEITKAEVLSYAS